MSGVLRSRRPLPLKLNQSILEFFLCVAVVLRHKKYTLRTRTFQTENKIFRKFTPFSIFCAFIETWLIMKLPLFLVSHEIQIGAISWLPSPPYTLKIWTPSVVQEAWDQSKTAPDHAPNAHAIQRIFCGWRWACINKEFVTEVYQLIFHSYLYSIWIR